MCVLVLSGWWSFYIISTVIIFLVLLSFQDRFRSIGGLVLKFNNTFFLTLTYLRTVFIVNGKVHSSTVSQISYIHRLIDVLCSLQ